MSTRLIHTRVAARVLMSAVMLGGAAILTGAFSAPAGADAIGVPTAVVGNTMAPCAVYPTNPGPLTFTKTAGSSLFSISRSGIVNFPDLIPPGNYAVSGTVSNGRGDWGVWRYDLYSPPLNTTFTNPDATSTIIETHGTGTVVAGHAFTDQISVDTGTDTYPLTFTTTSGTAFSVSSSGAVSAPSTLAPGTYIVSGTVSEPIDSYNGAWGYVLTVTAGTPPAVAPSTPAATAIGKAPAWTHVYDQGWVANGIAIGQTSAAVYGIGWQGPGAGYDLGEWALVGHFIPCKAPQTGLGDSSPRVPSSGSLIALGALSLAGLAGIAGIRARRRRA